MNRNAIKRILSSLTDFFAAPHANCQGCGSPLGAEDGWLCLSCANALQPLYAQNRSGCDICANCGEVYTGVACGNCKKRAVSTFRAASAYEYTDTVKRLVHAFKFQSVWRMDKWMAAEMKKAIDRANVGRFDVITWVPLHYSRHAERGYNQSKRLAMQLAKLYGKPCWGLLKRVRATVRQSTLSPDKRRSSLVNAFALRTDKLPERVLLIDDVRTTGETLVRCAQTLKNGGVGNVSAATFACSRNVFSTTKKYYPKSVAPSQPYADVFALSKTADNTVPDVRNGK